MIDAQKYGPWAIIAGGSEGVGSAFADRLAKQGFKLLLIARKPGPLEAVAADIRRQYGTEVRTLSVDLTAPDAIAKILDTAKGCEVGLLIYNAGADNSFKDFIDRPLEDSERMVMLNVMTPMRLVRHFAPAMAERKKGGIILCSSLAGLAGRPTNGVYSAVKAFVNVFAEVEWYELGKQGIDVLAAILPSVRTPAMERLGLKFDDPKVASDPFDIADEALAHINKGPALHSGGKHERAMQLRAMPRDKAVYAMAGIDATTNLTNGR
jgi:short-subunit dehydrogenase